MKKESTVQEEKDENLLGDIQRFLKNDTAALCFIAPLIPERISPSRTVSASIDIVDELIVEDAITDLKEAGVENLLLLINSFGGEVTSSYKIAQALRKNFKHISIFVPQIAASGGTLIALTGNKIIMGDMSSLTPIDVQAVRNGGRYSVNAMIRSFHSLKKMLEKKHEVDIEYPVKALADKLDPVELQEWIDKSNLMESHARSILTHENSSLSKKVEPLIKWLTTGCPTHSYAITFDEAREDFGKEIVSHCSSPEYKEIWEVMRGWLRKYVLKSSSQHHVSYVLPPKEENKNLNTPDTSVTLKEVVKDGSSK